MKSCARMKILSMLLELLCGRWRNPRKSQLRAWHLTEVDDNGFEVILATRSVRHSDDGLVSGKGVYILPAVREIVLHVSYFYHLLFCTVVYHGA